VIRCSTAGSLRRHREVIGDIDLLASSKQPAEVIEFFTSQPGIEKVLAKGETKASVLLEGGIQSDLRVVSDAEYSSALLYFTGSKEHNIVMRQRAIDRGLRLNEYGLFHSKVETRDPKLLVKCRTEEEMFEKLGLHYIPPEMREDMGEIALAEKGPLPRLIEWTDLKGSLHNHSTWSDGHQRPEEIAKAMCELGLAYWGITDHSKSSFQANGLDPVRVRQQLKEIASINATLAKEGTGFRLLTGTEVDILKDGKLDFPDDLLAELDVVIASIHQSFSQTEAETTARLIGAARNPYVHILGHLTGRLLLEREPYKVDHRAVIDACAETGTWIELNAHPMRFDMDWRWWPYAKSKGVKCAINCDATGSETRAFSASAPASRAFPRQTCVVQNRTVAEKDDYLADILVDLGFVSAEKVAETRREAAGGRVGVVDLLVANKVVRPADVTQAKAPHFGAEVVNLSELKIADDVIATIPRHIARKYRVVPVYKHDNSITVALADPSDLDTIDSLTHLLHGD
jgi:DNA polymerase (family 10)